MSYWRADACLKARLLRRLWGLGPGGLFSLGLSLALAALVACSDDGESDAAVTIRFDNRDSGVAHNLSVYESRSANRAIYVGETFSGSAIRDYQFRSPAAGDYFYRCDTHSDEMTGTLAVR